MKYHKDYEKGKIKSSVKKKIGLLGVRVSVMGPLERLYGTTKA